MSPSESFQQELTSIMETLARAAVVEILRLLEQKCGMLRVCETSQQQQQQQQHERKNSSTQALAETPAPLHVTRLASKPAQVPPGQHKAAAESVCFIKVENGEILINDGVMGRAEDEEADGETQTLADKLLQEEKVEAPKKNTGSSTKLNLSVAGQRGTLLCSQEDPLPWPQCTVKTESELVAIKSEREGLSAWTEDPWHSIHEVPLDSSDALTELSSDEAVAHNAEKRATVRGKAVPGVKRPVRHRGAGSERRPFVCNQCGRSFSHRCRLQRHNLIHTGQQPYICAYCSMRFTQQSTLQDHQRIHTEDRPYRCQFCGMGFLYHGNLTRHLRAHTGEKPFSCTQCGKSFTRLDYLQLHRRTHTKKKAKGTKIENDSKS